MSPKSVLIVDDEEICLIITSEMVKKYGLPVMLARDGLEAVELFERHSTEICCILLDLQMPKLSGIDAFRRIRRLNREVQVIITSGYLNESNFKTLKPLQPAGYLKKPVSYESLLDFLGQLPQA